MSKIVIFGDSLVQGALDLEKGGWANRLKLFFWERNIKGKGVYYEGENVIDFGVGGDKVLDVLRRFDCEIYNIRGEIDKVIFAVGINDAGFINGKKANSKNKFEQEFKRLLDAGIKQVGFEKIYVVGITNVCDSALKEWFSEERLAEFDIIMKRISIEKGCNFISMYGKLAKDEFCEDALHPNAKGHKKIFKIIKDTLME